MALSKPFRHVVLALTILGGIVLTVFGSRKIAFHLIGNEDAINGFSASDKSSSSWFLAHPILALIGTVTLPVPAVILRKYKGYWSKKIHAYVFLVAVLAILGAVGVVIANKAARNKNHFVTVHGVSGLILAIAYISLTAIGVVSLDPDYACLQGNAKNILKWIHKSGGRLLLVAGYWICFSGWYKWFQGAELAAAAVVASLATLLTYIDPIASSIHPEKDK